MTRTCPVCNKRRRAHICSDVLGRYIIVWCRACGNTITPLLHGGPDQPRPREAVR